MIATVVLILRIGLAIALYAFLGWALLTLLRELKQHGDRIAGRKTPGITLFIRIHPSSETQRFFAQPEVTIGRDTNCDLSMLDETMSAHHARIVYHHGQWWLEDLNSTNGTYLNQEKLTTHAVIITGDEFKCGNTQFGVRIDSDDTLSSSITF